MSKRDERLAATKYKNHESASAKNDRKSKMSGDPMEAMRSAVSAPRTEASKGRAASHRRGLPRLG